MSESIQRPGYESRVNLHHDAEPRVKVVLEGVAIFFFARIGPVSTGQIQCRSIISRDFRRFSRTRFTRWIFCIFNRRRPQWAGWSGAKMLPPQTKSTSSLACSRVSASSLPSFLAANKHRGFPQWPRGSTRLLLACTIMFGSDRTSLLNSRGRFFFFSSCRKLRARVTRNREIKNSGLSETFTVGQSIAIGRNAPSQTQTMIPNTFSNQLRAEMSSTCDAQLESANGKKKKLTSHDRHFDIFKASHHRAFQCGGNECVDEARVWDRDENRCFFSWCPSANDTNAVDAGNENPQSS